VLLNSALNSSINYLATLDSREKLDGKITWLLPEFLPDISRRLPFRNSRYLSSAGSSSAPLRHHGQIQPAHPARPCLRNYERSLKCSKDADETHCRSASRQCLCMFCPMFIYRKFKNPFLLAFRCIDSGGVRKCFGVEAGKLRTGRFFLTVPDRALIAAVGFLIELALGCL
jgi:hypothetical protein